MTDLELVACVDLDGVVADNRDRLPLIRSGDPDRRPDWPAYFAAQYRDTVYPHGRIVVTALASVMPIVWLTGRPERTREATRDWLRTNDLPHERLMMRPDTSRDPAPKIKLAMVDALRARGSVPAVILDDSMAIVSALVERRLPAVLVTWHGEHIESLRG